MLSEAQIETYAEQGFVIARAVVSDELLAQMRAQLDAWTEESRYEQANYGEILGGKARFDLQPGHSPDHPQLRRVANPIDISKAYREALFEGPVVELVAELLWPDVVFHHCKLNIKAPGAATEAIDEVIKSSAQIEHRQLAAIDMDGQTAHFTGAKALGNSAGAEGANCVAVGNLLDNDWVPSAMTAGFAADDGEYLADHLMASLAAGMEAGGEAGPVRSAALLVAGIESWPVIDLRIDWSEGDPIAELAALWAAYRPLMDDYVTRALNPEAAPSYGVPGDE
ncbi:MAG: DUF1028 domain-containing protein [Rhodospirillaceae bacterium]|nr:DUF1028 domain-containing protein [Rhodospirillaceae bacterium]